MKRSLLIILTILTIGLLGSCNYFKEGYKYGDTTKEFMTNLMHKDYDKCIGLLQLGANAQRKTYMDTIKLGLNYFHDKMAGQYGDNPSYTFLQVQEKGPVMISPVNNSTTVILQVSNGSQLGAVEAVFDNKSGKIISINPMDVKEQVPDMSSFWLFGILAVCIPVFNIYMLIRVMRSDMANKWLYYLAIILVNVTATGYSPSSGLFFKLASLQYTLGIHFIDLGYGSAWVFGIPVGSIFILWLLKTGRYTKDEKAKLKTQATQVKGKRFKA